MAILRKPNGKFTNVIQKFFLRCIVVGKFENFFENNFPSLPGSSRKFDVLRSTCLPSFCCCLEAEDGAAARLILRRLARKARFVWLKCSGLATLSWGDLRGLCLGEDVPGDLYAGRGEGLRDMCCDAGDRGDLGEYPAPAWYVGDGGNGQRGEEGAGEWYGDWDGVPRRDTAGLTARGDMNGEHREDLTTPGDLGGSWWDWAGIGDGLGGWDPLEYGLGLWWMVGVEGDTLDMGDREEDLRLLWSLSTESSVRVSASRESGAGRGLLLRFLVMLSPEPRTTVFLRN